MFWLLLGILYSFGYVTVGWLLRDQPIVLGWFRAAALVVPPMTGALVIVRPFAEGARRLLTGESEQDEPVGDRDELPGERVLLVAQPAVLLLRVGFERDRHAACVTVGLQP